MPCWGHPWSRPRASVVPDGVIRPGVPGPAAAPSAGAWNGGICRRFVVSGHDVADSVKRSPAANAIEGYIARGTRRRAPSPSGSTNHRPPSCSTSPPGSSSVPPSPRALRSRQLRLAPVPPCAGRGGAITRTAPASPGAVPLFVGEWLPSPSVSPWGTTGVLGACSKAVDRVPMPRRTSGSRSCDGPITTMDGHGRVQAFPRDCPSNGRFRATGVGRFAIHRYIVGRLAGQGARPPSSSIALSPVDQLAPWHLGTTHTLHERAPGLVPSSPVRDAPQLPKRPGRPPGALRSSRPRLQDAPGRPRPILVGSGCPPRRPVGSVA